MDDIDPDDYHPHMLVFKTAKGFAGVATAKIEYMGPKTSDPGKKTVITSEGIPDGLDATEDCRTLLERWNDRLWQLDAIGGMDDDGQSWSEAVEGDD